MRYGLNFKETPAGGIILFGNNMGSVGTLALLEKVSLK